MVARRHTVRIAKAKFRVRQHVRIRKKMKLAKDAEQNFRTVIFRIQKLIERRPHPLYELLDLNGTPRDGQFYLEEPTPGASET